MVVVSESESDGVESGNAIEIWIASLSRSETSESVSGGGGGACDSRANVSGCDVVNGNRDALRVSLSCRCCHLDGDLHGRGKVLLLMANENGSGSGNRSGPERASTNVRVSESVPTLGCSNDEVWRRTEVRPMSMPCWLRSQFAVAVLLPLLLLQLRRQPHVPCIP